MDDETGPGGLAGAASAENPRNVPGSFFSQMHNFPKVSTSGILPFSTRISVAGPIRISRAVSRSFFLPRFSRTNTPRLSSGCLGMSLLPAICETQLDKRNSDRYLKNSTSDEPYYTSETSGAGEKEWHKRNCSS